MDQTLLAGRVVLVTGAARGIGAAIATHAAQHGATVVLADIDLDYVERTAANIRSVGGAAHARQLDVTDADRVEELMAQVIAELGSLDGLVNNAGRFAMAAMEDSSVRMWQDMLATNVLGVAICGQAAARHMLARGAGSIVNITSGAQCGLPAMSVYGATKGAVASLTYTWALELGPRGIRVNAVSPMAATRMIDTNREFRAQHPELGELPPQPPAAANAPVVTYLLSELSAALNGQVLRVTGGDLGLMSHPAVVVPVVHRDEWTVEQIADAFRAQQPIPAGLVGYPAAVPVPPESAEWRTPAAHRSAGDG